MKYLIWDFNGTILDDMEVCLDTENEIIKKYLDRPIMTKDEYLHKFTFPVKKYYEAVGFTWDKVSYEEVGDDWFKIYCSKKDQYKVHDGVIDILKSNKEKGIKNIILSASSLKELKIQLDELKISEYFDEVLGIDNIYADSKIEIAKKFMKDKDPKDFLMVGDTLHDLEVAKILNVECVLVASGHQAKDILVENHDKVIDSIKDLKI